MLAFRPLIGALCAMPFLGGAAHGDRVGLRASVSEICYASVHQEASSEASLLIVLTCNIEQFTLLFSGVPESVSLLEGRSESGLTLTTVSQRGLQGRLIRPGTDFLALTFDAGLPQNGSVNVTVLPAA